MARDAEHSSQRRSRSRTCRYWNLLGTKWPSLTVMIISDGKAQAKCHWDLEKRKCLGNERNVDVAVGYGGPVAQVLFAPESLGEHIESFRNSIHQQIDVLNSAGCAGWLGDLSLFLGMRERNWPAHMLEEFYEIENKVKLLLSRDSVGRAVLALAAELERKQAIDGGDAERIIQAQLAKADCVGENYVN